MAIPTAVNRNLRFCLRRPLPRQTSTLNHHLDIVQRARRNMSTRQSTDSVPHELRTASEPRQDSLHPVRLSKVTQVNPTVRLLQLTLPRDQSSEKASEVRECLLLHPPSMHRYISHISYICVPPCTVLRHSANLPVLHCP